MSFDVSAWLDERNRTGGCTCGECLWRARSLHDTAAAEERTQTVAAIADRLAALIACDATPIDLARVLQGIERDLRGLINPGSTQSKDMP